MTDEKEFKELQDLSPTSPPVNTKPYDEDLGGSTRIDGMSTTSLEETASDPFSDEFLRIDAAGFCGLLERIPLMLKLIFMILVSLLGFVGVGVFLLAIQSVTIRQARLARTFQGLSSDLGRVISAVQNEREYANQFLAASPTSPDIADIERLVDKAYVDTDLLKGKMTKYIDTYNLYSYGVMRTELNNLNATLANLLKWRTDTLTRATTTTFAFSYYNSLVSSMLDLLGRFVYIKGKDPTISSYLMLLRMIEQEWQIKSAGVLAGTQSAITYNRIRAFVKFAGVRDDQYTSWITTTAPEIGNYYKELIPNSLLNNIKAQIEYAIADRGPNTTTASLPNFSLALWNGNYTTKLNALSLVENKVRSRMDSEAKQQLDQAVGLIVGVIVVIAFFFLLSSIVSITVAYTIVGPWRRLNMIQEIAISKFVPKGLLKLLNCAKITDVALGLFAEKQLTMMNVDIKQFTKASRHFSSSSEIFEFLNAYLNYIGPLIRKHGGFIHSYSGDGFSALFTDSSKGVKAGVEIQTAIETFNKINTKYPPISVAIGVHTAKVLVGTVGENERMEGTILGSHNHVPSMLEKLTKKYNTKTLVTRSIVANMNNKVGKQLDQRKIGVILCEDEKGEKQDLDVIELTTMEKDNKKDQAKNYLEKGVTAFYHGIYNEAIQHFTEVLKLLPDDILAKMYLARSEQFLEQIKNISADWLIGHTLRNPELMKGFEAFSHSEHSGENIAFWKAIENYKTRDASERRILASKMANDYLSLHGNYTININEKLKIDVNDQLKGTANVGVDLFNAIQVELEVLMADTYKRYKASSFFLEAFQRIPQAPKRPYLDTL